MTKQALEALDRIEKNGAFDQNDIMIIRNVIGHLEMLEFSVSSAKHFSKILHSTAISFIKEKGLLEEFTDTIMQPKIQIKDEIKKDGE